MSGTAGGPIFHVEPKGALGSRMFQYLVALRFRELVPDCRISNVMIPEWGIDHPPLELEEPVAWSIQSHHVDLQPLAERVRSGQVRSIVYTGRGQRRENFPSLETCRSAFRPAVISPARFGERYIVCHVRPSDIGRVRPDPNAPLSPAAFYAEIIARTGLIPVFVGGGAGGDHTAQLRRQFPHGVFLQSGDNVLDFEVIRQAQHIVLGVSSFAWLAAWLSDAERIFMAVNGRFNPMQEPAVDLLPLGDPRYQFCLFPINYDVPPQRRAALHGRIAPLCRFIPQGQLQRFIGDAPRFDPSVDEMLEQLDVAWYLARNRDVTVDAEGDGGEAARRHYRDIGWRERRSPFRMSEQAYAERYPMAALEVSQGDYSSFVQHYVAVGRKRGYRLLPDECEPGEDAACDAVKSTPCIDLLAEETVVVEHAAPVSADFVVVAGGSFSRLLCPQSAASFNRRHATEDMRIFRLREVVLDSSMMMLFSGHQPIPETFYLMNQEDYDYALVKPLHPEATNDAAHHIIGCNAAHGSYYHWMMQSLPAIDWGVRMRRHADIALAVPPLRPWQVEALALLGHATWPRLTLRPVAHYALASAEYAAFLGARMSGIVSRAAAETFARVRSAVAPAEDGADAIYVARTDAAARVAVNEAALIAMLERQGVRVVVPGTLPVTRQLALFRRAALVIGPHGAGLSNIIACEPGTQVYELVPSHYPNPCFNRLAQTCRLNWWGDVFEAEAGDGNPMRRTWRIDLDAVARRLDEIRNRMANREPAL